jgi:hypothetical protein
MRPVPAAVSAARPTGDGMRVRGWPVATIARGEVVVAGGGLHAEPGRGRFGRRERRGRGILARWTSS